MSSRSICPGLVPSTRLTKSYEQLLTPGCVSEWNTCTSTSTSPLTKISARSSRSRVLNVPELNTIYFFPSCLPGNDHPHGPKLVTPLSDAVNADNRRLRNPGIISIGIIVLHRETAGCLQQTPCLNPHGCRLGNATPYTLGFHAAHSPARCRALLPRPTPCLDISRAVIRVRKKILSRGFTYRQLFPTVDYGSLSLFTPVRVAYTFSSPSC